VQQHTNTGKPYQLKTATNSSLVGSTGITATVTTKYDNAGNLTRLGVVRPSGKCVSMHNGTAMASPSCSQFYAYDYDEVGRLSRARRWDSSAQSFNPDTFDVNTTASIELRYRYDANDQRVIKRVYSSTASNQRHTLYVFGSLEVHRTAYTNNVYTINADTTVPYAMANGVRLAQLHYSNVSSPAPAIGGTGVSALDYKTNTAPELHVLLELGDHLGSTGTVLDKLSGELVEKTAYLPFGAREADYRPSRWSGFREDYGFTGKEEDVEVGLTYFGKRYLSAQLGRWVSPDPLAVHAAGKADFNLYAYVSGAVLKSVDPVGLCPDASSGGSCNSPSGASEGATSVSPEAQNGRTEATRAELTDVKRIAQFADAAYGSNKGLPNGGKERVAPEQLEKMGLNPAWFRNDRSGFNAALFIDSKTSNYVLAFEGTDLKSPQDRSTDLEAASGVAIPKQYREAMILAADVQAAVSKEGKGLTLTGHSLGGGLAAAASRYTGERAVTFNAAGLSPYVSSVAYLSGPNGGRYSSVTNYSASNDVLTSTQAITPFPAAAGRQETLPAARMSTPFSFEQHKMVQVINAIDAEIARLGHEKP
jgi:RHS repeat-associated protein